MKITGLFAIITITLAVSGCATSNNTASTDVATSEAVIEQTTVVKVEKQASTDDANRKICKRTSVTSSRLSRTKTCKTKDEWELFRQKNKDNVNKIQRQNNGSGQEGG